MMLPEFLQRIVFIAEKMGLANAIYLNKHCD
jgi:hypothetical protein